MTIDERAVAVVQTLLAEAESARPSNYPPWREHEVNRLASTVAHAIRAVATELRERCAQVAEIEGERWEDASHGIDVAVSFIAIAIRSIEP